MAETSLTKESKNHDEEKHQQRLEDFKYFEDVLAQDPKKGRKVIKLCRLLNKLVPITIAQSFHNMNCYEIYKNHPHGKYWSMASLFVVGNTSVSKYVLQELQKDEPDCVQEANHPLLSKELHDRFKDDFKLYKKKIESIATVYNSWVFVQIPLFPSMLYYWWLESTFSLLAIEQVVVDFYHLKFPKCLQATVQRLINVVERARFNLNLCLQCLMLKLKDGTQFETRHYEDIILTVYTVIYQFQGNTSLFNAISCLKRMCWNESSAREVTISPGLQKRRDLGEHFKILCTHYFASPLWEYLPASVFMLERLVVCTGCSYCKEIIWKQKLKDLEDAKKMAPDLTLETLKLFICNNFISKNGRFCVADKEALLAHADDPEVWKLFYKWNKNKGFLVNKAPVHDGDSGDFVNILAYTADLEQVNLEAAITQRLATLSGIKPLAIGIEGPDMTLKEINKKILKDLKVKPQWTFPLSFQESQMQVDGDKKLVKDNLIDNGAAAIFQYQIKSMLLRISKKYHVSETMNPSNNLHFIQYLLPCFVASYFDLKNDKRVSLKARNFYLNFIKQLIKIWDDDSSPSGFYFKEETVCFLKWKFESVCMDLEGYLYNDLEDPGTKDLTEEEQPPFITSSMRSNCFDVLTDFLGKTEDQKYFLHWKKELYLLSTSLQKSMFKLTQKPPGFTWKWGAELRAMSVLCRMLAAETLQRQGFIDKTTYDHTNIFLGAIFKFYAKTEKSMKIRLMPGATKKDTWSDFQAKVETESMKLSEQQQLALALFMCLSSSEVKNMKDAGNDLERIFLSCDAVERAYIQIKSGKHLKLQQTLSFWQRDEHRVNLAQVSYKYAMEVAPLCYSVVTCRLTKDMKIQMKEPGEITFCPVRHCRWCGQVETEKHKLFVCQFCKDIPEYPDVNLFCSLDCEEKALDQKHREEHSETIKMQLGLSGGEDGQSATRLDQLEPGIDEKDLEPNVAADSMVQNKALPEIKTADEILEGAVVSQQRCKKRRLQKNETIVPLCNDVSVRCARCSNCLNINRRSRHLHNLYSFCLSLFCLLPFVVLYYMGYFWETCVLLCWLCLYMKDELIR